jgi:serine/threonine protein kinase
MSSSIIGEEFQGYQVLAPLGQGGFGRTFLVRAEVDNREVKAGQKYVIKEFYPTTTDPESLKIAQERFLREAAVLLDMGRKHTQIPRLLNYFRNDDGCYLVQEYIEGETLAQKLKREGLLSSADVAKILLQVLPILDFLHSRKIIHRDVKPDNIILRANDGKPVLIDFGAVKESVNTVISTSHGKAVSVIVGSPGFMSPEQGQGRPVYASDLYSLGLTAIYLLTGKSAQDLNTHYYTQELIWQAAAKDVDPHLAEVLERAIRFNPRERFKTAQVMLEAIKRLPLVTTVGQTDEVPQTSSNSTVLPSPTAPTQHFLREVILTPPPIKRLVSPCNRPKPRWRLRLSIFAAVTAGVAGTLYYVSRIQYQQQILTDVKALQQQQRYPECVQKIESLGAVHNLPLELQALKSNCLLSLAQQEAKQGRLGLAIARISEIPVNSPIRNAASRLQEQWSQQILERATQDYLQGRLQAAIEQANSIPEIAPQRITAHASIQSWQSEWERNQKSIQAARAALRVGDWQMAQSKASEVTTPYWQRQAEPLLQQANRLAEKPIVVSP